MNTLWDAYGVVSCVLLTLIVIVILVSAFLPREARKELLHYLARKLTF
jgi:hypothetical protein